MVQKRSKVSKKSKLEKKIGFEFFAPQAIEVHIAANFNNWDSTQTPLKRDKKGTWKTALTLNPGRYEYRYLVDGNWQNEQRPVECVPNMFGSWNNVVEVQ